MKFFLIKIKNSPGLILNAETAKTSKKKKNYGKK